MLRVRGCAVAGLLRVAVLVAVWAFPATAEASAQPLTLTPHLHRGWIDVRIDGGVPGSDATVRERGSVVAHVRLGTHGSAAARDVAEWTCTRRERRLTVTDGTSSATAAVRTPSCRRRVAVSIVPRRPHAGSGLLVMLRDRWHVGRPTARACLVAPVGSRPCVRAQLDPAPARLRLAAPRPGSWTLTVRGAGIDVERRMRILPHGPQLRVLAAGDSLMERVAAELTRQLTEQTDADVHTDVIFGAGLVDRSIADWRLRLRRAGRDFAPDVVVLFLGGGDALPIGSIRCCGRPWQTVYAERARRVARTAMRGGAAQVYWLTLPAPESAGLARAWARGNIARAKGVAALAPWTTQLDTSAILTPGDVFRPTMVIDGRETTIRTDDGVHLTAAGARLVADRVLAAMRSDQILP